MQTKDVTSPSLSLKPGEVSESVRLTNCFSVDLVEAPAVLFLRVCSLHCLFPLLPCSVSGNKSVGF